MQKTVEHKASIRKTFNEIDVRIQAILEELTRQGVDLTYEKKRYEDLTFDDLSRLDFVDRIHPDAQRMFVEDELGLQAEFMQARAVEAFVMAIDLRRSTDLMLKTRSVDGFVSLISKLSNRLRAIVLDHHGVFDKFTGDGVLAFFPSFYSGPDGFHALSAAEEAHREFETLYAEASDSFYTVLSPKEVGLGIGIDHGVVNVVVISETATIVGHPVVYACRLAEGPPGITLVNYPAYEKVKGNKALRFVARRFQMKHEGEIDVHEAQLSGETYLPLEPQWRKRRRAKQ